MVEVKVSQFTDDDSIYNNTQRFQLLALINELSKIIGYNNHVQESVVFLIHQQ